uniref:EGF-like domain-containing protein n=1 Tax=Ditylum brightwellii TaxID=49249 RepID=A0A6V2A4F5_9STRA|mmetsp:Transcript_2044/g.2944  ORF Transcript_2044/g.2944 Transcript_2044/m.2944 type:complete len:380 (-) Transcript_2044:321-1460(-)
MWNNKKQMIIGLTAFSVLSSTFGASQGATAPPNDTSNYYYYGYPYAYTQQNYPYYWYPNMFYGEEFNKYYGGFVYGYGYNTYYGYEDNKVHTTTSTKDTCPIEPSNQEEFFFEIDIEIEVDCDTSSGLTQEMLERAFLEYYNAFIDCVCPENEIEYTEIILTDFVNGCDEDEVYGGGYYGGGRNRELQGRRRTVSSRTATRGDCGNGCPTRPIGALAGSAVNRRLASSNINSSSSPGGFRRRLHESGRRALMSGKKGACGKKGSTSFPARRNTKSYGNSSGKKGPPPVCFNCDGILFAQTFGEFNIEVTEIISAEFETVDSCESLFSCDVSECCAHFPFNACPNYEDVCHCSFHDSNGYSCTTTSCRKRLDLSADPPMH